MNSASAGNDRARKSSRSVLNSTAGKSREDGTLGRVSTGLILLVLMTVGLSSVAAAPNTRGVTFQPHTEYATGTDTAGVASGDFNRDGIVDLVTANLVDSSVSVLLGKGD